jgi:hypothetical protein
MPEEAAHIHPKMLLIELTTATGASHMSGMYVIDILLNSTRVVQVSSISAAAALEEAARYARIYAQDGPITFKMKNPRKPST